MLRNPGRAHRSGALSDGYTLIEVIFVSALIALVSAIAVPTVFRSKLAANETSAVGNLRIIHTGQLTYSLTCGYGLYATSFPDLAMQNSESFLPADLTASPTPLKSGYTFELQAGPNGPSLLTDCQGAALAAEYYVTAVPLTIGSTGNRGFASNHDSTIWQDTSGTAPTEPFATGGSVSAIE